MLGQIYQKFKFLCKYVCHHSLKPEDPVYMCLSMNNKITDLTKIFEFYLL